MPNIKQYLEIFSRTKPRVPQHGAELAATKGAVVIMTHDNQSLILTPRLARDLAQALPRMAAQAEGRHYEQA